MPVAARAARAGAGRAVTSATSYFALSRSHRYSITFALPLVLAYEALAAMLSSSDGGIRNGADVLLRSVFIAIGGRNGSRIFFAAVVLGGLFFVVRDLRRSGGGLQRRIFGLMLAESAGMALAFGLVVGLLTAKLLGSLNLMMIQHGALDNVGWSTRLMLSLGAGLYEELFFRVLLVSGLNVGARALIGASPRTAGILATLVGAIIFSAFHYIGSMGDPFTVQSFVFRAISGVAFSALYLTRGFGITAWTHALYDAFLLLF